MRKRIGWTIAEYGARLWEKGGFWTGRDYEDLNIVGKIGYHLMIKGLTLAGTTPEDLEKLSNDQALKNEEA